LRVVVCIASQYNVAIGLLICYDNVRMPNRSRLIEVAAKIHTLREQLSRLEEEFERLLVAERPAKLHGTPETEVDESEPRVRGLAARILRVFEDHRGQPFSAEDLATMLRIDNTNTARAMLSRLVASHRIVRIDRGKYMMPPPKEEDDIPF